MYLCLIICLSFYSCEEFKYWEQISAVQKQSILTSCESKLMIDYYNGKLKLNDDIDTQNLFNDLAYSKKSMLPLSLNLMNKCVLTVDGAPAELLGEYLLDFTMRNPSNVLCYLSKERKINCMSRLSKEYALHIGLELYLSKKGKSLSIYNYNAFRNTLNQAAVQDESLAEFVKLFLQSVDETIANSD